MVGKQYPLDWPREKPKQGDVVRAIVKTLLEKNLVGDFVMRGWIVVVLVHTGSVFNTVELPQGFHMVRAFGGSEFNLWSKILAAPRLVRRRLSRRFPSLQQLELPSGSHRVSVEKLLGV